MGRSTKPESKFKLEIRKALPEVHWQPIESGTMMAGIPDMNGCYKGVEVWIETKIWPRKLTPAQANWIIARYNAGGRVWIAVKRGTGIKLWNGYKARDVLRTGWETPADLWLELGGDAINKPTAWALFKKTVFGRS